MLYVERVDKMTKAEAEREKLAIKRAHENGFISKDVCLMLQRNVERKLNERKDSEEDSQGC